MTVVKYFLMTSLLFSLVACNGEGTQPGTDGDDSTDVGIGGENPDDGSNGGTTDGGSNGGTTDGGSNGGTTDGGSNGGTTGGSTGGGTTTPSDGVPTAAKNFKVNITYVNFTAAQKTKYEQAVAIVKKVVASKTFMDSVKNHKYGGKVTYVDNGGKTNAAIYQNILDGNEKLNNTKNNTMDVEIELYYANNTTVGYTYANSKRIWVNTKYFNTYTPSKVAGNLFHEWLHKLGYGHASSYSTSRDYSVPYAIGYMISSQGAKL